MRGSRDRHPRVFSAKSAQRIEGVGDIAKLILRRVCKVLKIKDGNFGELQRVRKLLRVKDWSSGGKVWVGFLRFGAGMKARFMEDSSMGTLFCKY